MADLRLAATVALLALAACERAEAPRTDAGPATTATIATIGPEPVPTSSVPAPPQTDLDRAVAVALALQAQPDATDSILVAHAMSVESLEALMLRVASDSALSEAYRRRVGGGT